MAKRRWSQAAIDNYRAANDGAYPVGQEPEPTDYGKLVTQDKARLSYALAHGRATGADSAAARSYGILKEEKPEAAKTPAQILADRKASATLRYAEAPQSMTRADSVYAGIKEEKPKESKQAPLAERIIAWAKKRRELNEMANPSEDAVREGKYVPGYASRNTLMQTDAAYADSLELASDAMKAQTEWLPQYERIREEMGDVEARKWLLKTTGSSPEELMATIKLFQ